MLVTRSDYASLERPGVAVEPVCPGVVAVPKILEKLLRAGEGRVLKKLEDAGKLRREGNGPSSRYVLG